MDQERKSNPEFLASIIQVKNSSKHSKKDIMLELSEGKRVVFIGNEAMEFIIGGGLHTELTKELGVEENKDNFMKGFVQYTRHGSNISGGSYFEFFERMGVDNKSAYDLWKKIRSKIIMAIG